MWVVEWTWRADMQKEVERRRRENINDGIAEIARYIPNGQDPKLGKGQLLKLAAEYLNEMTERIRRFDAEMAIKEREKQELRVGLLLLPWLTSRQRSTTSTPV